MRAGLVSLVLFASQCVACVDHGARYQVMLSPDFTVEQVEGIKAGGADWQKWVPVSFEYHWGNEWVSSCLRDPYTMCVYPVTRQVFADDEPNEGPSKTWGDTNCDALTSDSCMIRLSTDWNLPAIEWQALAAHEMGHAMGFRKPDWPNNGHEASGSGALMAPTLESVVVTCTDMARWYTVRHQVVPPCP